MKDAFVIGIAGGSGSGKSTFAKRLKEQFPDEIALVSCDNYYLARHNMPLSERKLQNYDSPEAFEFDLMVRQIQELKSGKDIACPVYDFTAHDRSEQILQIAAKPVVLIDGILIFVDPQLRNLMDMRIYVETDADERIFAVSVGIWWSVAEIWTASLISTWLRSSRCTMPSSSRPRLMRTSLSTAV